MRRIPSELIVNDLAPYMELLSESIDSTQIFSICPFLGLEINSPNNHNMLLTCLRQC